jgi:flagellar biosynthesis protein FlhG
MRMWAVAGGKGGTGKSLIANGLAISLAERGAQVILVDADYGGPNQHTYCGIRKPASNLGQFFEDRRPLEELALATSVPGLRLIPGNVNTANTDGITWAQKQKLFRHLRLLQADHVLLDLGAGSQYDTLDSFLLADVQIGVIAPDAMTIENFYLFLKNLKYRQLGNLLSGAGLKEQAKEIWKHRADHGITDARSFVQHLRGLSLAFAQRLDREQERICLHVVLNQVREFNQVELGLAVKSAVHKHFQLDARFAGYLRYDKDLWQQFGQDQPAIKGGASFALRRARDAAGFTLDQVAAETNVRRESLSALEDERFEQLRLATVNVRGYLTAFVNTIGLPADDVVPAYMERFIRWQARRPGGSGAG